MKHAGKGEEKDQFDATQFWPEEWVSKLHNQTIIKQADDFAELVEAAYIASMNRL